MADPTYTVAQLITEAEDLLGVEPYIVQVAMRENGQALNVSMTIAAAQVYVADLLSHATTGGSPPAPITPPVITDPPINTALPAVTGSTVVGQTLTVSTGSWANVPTSYAYQWQRSPTGTSWANIAGAASSTYVTQSADIGDLLRCAVTATNVDGSATVQTASTGAITSS